MHHTPASRLRNVCRGKTPRLNAPCLEELSSRVNGPSRLRTHVDNPQTQPLTSARDEEASTSNAAQLTRGDLFHDLVWACEAH